MLFEFTNGVKVIAPTKVIEPSDIYEDSVNLSSLNDGHDHSVKLSRLDDGQVRVEITSKIANITSV